VLGGTRSCGPTTRKGRARPPPRRLAGLRTRPPRPAVPRGPEGTGRLGHRTSAAARTRAESAPACPRSAPARRPAASSARPAHRTSIYRHRTGLTRPPRPPPSRSLRGHEKCPSHQDTGFQDGSDARTSSGKQKAGPIKGFRLSVRNLGALARNVGIVPRS
jgi:hypothetical protein